MYLFEIYDSKSMDNNNKYFIETFELLIRFWKNR